MPVSSSRAKVNGVVIRNWLQPLRVIGENGRVSGVEFACMSEESGSYAPTGKILVLPCDRVLKAIGQQFLGSLDDGSGPDTLTLEQGRIRIDANRRTSDEKVWAGGDCVAGGDDLTVAAVQDGKLAAESIHSMLTKG